VSNYRIDTLLTVSTDQTDKCIYVGLLLHSSSKCTSYCILAWYLFPPRCHI